MNDTKHNKTDLIFHVGYSKCASSTFQNLVFPKTKGYLGAGRNIPKQHKYAKYFQALSPCGPKLKGNLNGTKKWADQVIQLKNEDFPDCNRLILSSEFFITNSLLKTRPIIPFFKKFNEKVWTYGDVKVILVIRNQAERLASLYAQGSIENKNSSQKNFEKYARTVIKKYYENFNYSKCIEELNESLGENNVCVLLMEDINDVRFWDKLKDFAYLPNFNPSEMVKGKRVNQKKIKENTWQLQDYSIDIHAKNKINNYFKLIWPAYKLPSHRAKAKLFCESILKKIYQYKTSDSTKNNKEIFLSEEVKSIIRENFSESNKKLEVLLKRDLHDLGYY